MEKWSKAKAFNNCQFSMSNEKFEHIWQYNSFNGCLNIAMLIKLKLSICIGLYIISCYKLCPKTHQTHCPINWGWPPLFRLQTNKHYWVCSQTDRSSYPTPLHWQNIQTGVSGLIITLISSRHINDNEESGCSDIRALNVFSANSFSCCSAAWCSLTVPPSLCIASPLVSAWLAL